MNKNLLVVLIFLLALVVYLSLLSTGKIDALGKFFHPILGVLIFLGLGKKAVTYFKRENEEE